jgi:hypothetical protein
MSQHSVGATVDDRLIFTGLHDQVKYLPNIANDHHRRIMPSHATTSPAANSHAPPPVVASGASARPTGSARIPVKKIALKIASARTLARLAPRRMRNACENSPSANAATLMSKARKAPATGRCTAWPSSHCHSHSASRRPELGEAADGVASNHSRSKSLRLASESRRHKFRPLVHLASSRRRAASHRREAGEDVRACYRICR